AAAVDVDVDPDVVDRDVRADGVRLGVDREAEAAEARRRVGDRHARAAEAAEERVDEAGVGDDRPGWEERTDVQLPHRELADERLERVEAGVIDAERYALGRVVAIGD